MNWDQIEGQWKDLKGEVRQKWSKLTDSDFDNIAGKKDRFVGMLQEKYGETKEKIGEDINSFLDGLKETLNKKPADSQKTEKPSTGSH